jgi:hypothetical protein
MKKKQKIKPVPMANRTRPPGAADWLAARSFEERLILSGEIQSGEQKEYKNKNTHSMGHNIPAGFTYI